MTRWIGLAIAAAVVIAVPAFASGQPERAPGSIVAVDFGFQNPADGSPLVTIQPGETVTFSYPEGSSFHNVQFTKEQPSSCTLTAGGSGPVPPLPAAPTGDGWSGTCTFNAEGTYEFVCGAHPGMIGAVLALPVGATPTPTPSVYPTATPRQATAPSRRPPPPPDRHRHTTPTAAARSPHRRRRRHRPATGPRRSPRPRAGSRSPAPSAARRSRAHSRSLAPGRACASRSCPSASASGARHDRSTSAGRHSR